MLKLKYLSIRYTTRSGDMQLNPNENIVSLCTLTNQSTTENFTQMIKAAPNVKKLVVYALTHEKLEMINRHCTKLEYLMFYDRESIPADDPVWAAIRPFRFTSFE